MEMVSDGQVVAIIVVVCYHNIWRNESIRTSLSLEGISIELRI